MRSRLQLAVMLVNEQRLPEAIGECRALLRLNPNDNQGVRDPLLGLLLRVGDTAGAEDLIRQYDEDEGATFMWGRALARFQAAGADGANEALARAIKTNRYVFELLTDRRGLPEDRPSYYAFGDVNEAAHCIELQGMAWSQTPGALDWLLNSKVRLPRKR